jgi:hypothetical protein
MSVSTNKTRKLLALGWMARAGNAAFITIDAFGRVGVSPPAGRSFARFCAVFQESVKKEGMQSARLKRPAETFLLTILRCYVSIEA